jgi:protein-S-isoprenylcysteine O-methyltransferase Ste14
MSGRRYWFPKPYADVVAKLRVVAGFIMVAAFLYFSAPTIDSLMIGVPIAIAGLALRAWAAGHLEKNMQLATGGPYAYVRNPLYLGTLTVAAGFAIASRRWELGVLFAVMFIFVYLPVIELEEQHLRKLFPSYEQYAAAVPVLLPRMNARAGGKFRWSIYRKNEEFQAALGLLAGLAVLIWKVL